MRKLLKKAWLIGLMLGLLVFVSGMYLNLRKEYVAGPDCMNQYVEYYGCDLLSHTDIKFFRSGWPVKMYCAGESTIFVDDAKESQCSWWDDFVLPVRGSNATDIWRTNTIVILLASGFISASTTALLVTINIIRAGNKHENSRH